jgi:hypothetical protein
LTGIAQVIFERKTPPFRSVLATSSTKKEMVQAGWTVIIADVVGMRFCTGPLLTADIETETFSATITEFKEAFVQNRSTDLTVMNLHSH